MSRYRRATTAGTSYFFTVVDRRQPIKPLSNMVEVRRYFEGYSSPATPLWLQNGEKFSRPFLHAIFKIKRLTPRSGGRKSSSPYFTLRVMSIIV